MALSGAGLGAVTAFVGDAQLESPRTASRLRPSLKNSGLPFSLRRAE